MKFGTTSLAAALALAGEALAATAGKPNIVVIMTDDQDARLGSTDVQKHVQKLMAEGMTLQNHFVTTAQCCPSRTSYLRGQAAHNTNLTHVRAPGGGWEKFTTMGQDKDYLPHWLKKAGYQTEYLGKIMNGYNMATYAPKPLGWDHTDILLNPYTYEANNVVTSINGERPVFYRGFHQTDVFRAKALARIEHLTSLDKPFYIQIAPTAPHTQSDGPVVPLERHMYSLLDAKAPRNPNFNPDNAVQANKVSWVKRLPRLNESEVGFVDWQYRSRLQALLGVDELLEDVVALLEEKGVLDNTYVIYTSDNGFHTGTHRQIGGKGLPYIEDTTVPMIIRGPGVKAGAVSKIPSTHIDMAPTYLEIAGVKPEDYPPFFDGRSLLSEWHGKSDCGGGGGGNGTAGAVSKEILNVEFWGSIDNAGKPDFGRGQPQNSYKTIRIVGEKQAWLFSRWCEGNATELYNTLDDPYELTNLALDPTPEHTRLMHRLNGLLLVTKSCEREVCRRPWPTLQHEAGPAASFRTLDEAMSPQYDAFFASLPQVGFQECMFYQYAPNEIPFYPPRAQFGLGTEWRGSSDNYPVHDTNGTRVPGNPGRMGTAAQRHATLADILKSARNVTNAEIGSVVECVAPKYCAGGGDWLVGTGVESGFAFIHEGQVPQAHLS